MISSTLNKGAFLAILASVLFGASTPAAKLLIGHISPQLLAGLLYLGSGLGLSFLSIIVRRYRASSSQETTLSRRDLPWLGGAVVFGGILGPLLLTTGLNTTAGGTASLLLNLEAVFTALLAWFVFKENFDRRIFAGMVAIIMGSVILAWQPGESLSISFGALLISGACLCWAVDNNLTRNISNADPVQIAAVKGLIAGIVNTAIALGAGQKLPAFPLLLAAAFVGLLGYGISLVLFIQALRRLGTARTGAYFSTAPFVGALLSILLLHDPLTITLLSASAFMAFGLWLHLTEVHEHEHYHQAEEHEHMHTHDEHHQHEHDHASSISAEDPHSHLHRHAAITHLHPHFPDTHHRHDH